MRQIKAKEVTELAKNLCLKANYNLRQDIIDALKRAKNQESLPRAKQIIQQILDNAEIARQKLIPLCQDCGYPNFFIELGEEIYVPGGLVAALQKGVSLAYQKENLRQSIIADAFFERQKFSKKALANIHIQLVPGEKLRVVFMPKGGGSDNASQLRMFNPTTSQEEILAFVLETIKENGASACPPLIIGVGIGGSFDNVALLSKKALLKDISKSQTNPKLAAIEESWLKKINQLGIGPAGLGGESTALAVSILTAPSHMASLPVAVNIGCNCLRTAKGEL